MLEIGICDDERSCALELESLYHTLFSKQKT